MLQYKLLFLNILILSINLNSSNGASQSPIIHKRENAKRWTSKPLEDVAYLLPVGKSSDSVSAFDFDCFGEYCARAQKAIKAVNKEFSNILNVKFPIKVMLNFSKDFVDSEEDTFSAIGGTTKEVFLSDRDGFPITYPQAVVRQAGIRDDYEEYDIHIKVNAKEKLSFHPHKHTKKGEAYDFRYILIHELLHGLGFHSSWQPTEPYLGLLPPSSYHEVRRKDKITNYIFEGLAISAFDKYLYMNGQSMFTIAKNLSHSISNSLRRNYLDEAHFLRDIEWSAANKRAVEIRKECEKKGTVYFYADCGKIKMMIDTTLSPFDERMSMNHFDLTFVRGTSDVIFASSSDCDDNIEEAIDPINHTIISDNIRRILQLIGYEIYSTTDSIFYKKRGIRGLISRVW